MGEFDRIYLVNDMPFPTAIFRFTMDLHRASGGQSRIIHLGSKAPFWEYDYEGYLFKGTGKGRLNNVLNYSLPLLSYTNLGDLLSRIMSEEGVLHYANQSVRPLRKSGIDIASVNDNPMSVLHSELYSLSPLRKMLTKRHYDKYSKFTNVIANSKYVARNLVNYGFDGKITVINPMKGDAIKRIGDKSSMRKLLGLPEDKFLVLSVTNGVRRKNLEYVDAVVKSLGDDYRLVRIGEKVGDSITYKGISDEDVNRIYNACDLLLFPSLEEGFGKPVIEAMEVGIPVVVSDIEVLHEVAGDAAVFVDPKSVADGTAGVREALNDRDTLVNRGLRRSLMYRDQVFIDKIKDYYRSVLK